MSDVELIKKWLKQQPHLPDSWDEKWISTLLRHCGFSLEKSKRKIDSYFTMKNAASVFFSDRDVAETRRMSAFVNVFLIPHLIMPDRYKVTVFSSNSKSYEGFNIIHAWKTLLMLLDARCVSGDDESLSDVYVVDLSVAYCAYVFKKLTVSQMKAYMVCLQDAFPNKIKGFHILNMSPIMQTILNVMKPLMKEKLRNRIYVHPNLESLYKLVPKDNLPEEYGGTAGTMASLSEETCNFLENYQEWFRQTENVNVDESKRPGQAKNYDEVFGLDGSFRQLKID